MTGAGDDTVKLDYVVAVDNFMASLGDGNDVITVKNHTVSRQFREHLPYVRQYRVAEAQAGRVPIVPDLCRTVVR